jgi:predicted TPR repeat methyltransferase
MNGSAPETSQAALHDAYAADYDAQVGAYGCYLAEALFGLSYEFIRPGQRLLDLGIGSGLSAAPFARAGLRVWGADFSASMLDLCRAKGIAEELRQLDLLAVPWPYPSGAFDHVISCGLFHFIPDLDAIFGEAARVVMPGGLFAFTTKDPATIKPGRGYDRHASGDFDVFDHEADYVVGLLAAVGFRPQRTLRCFVGDDVFTIWVARRAES